MSAVTLRFHWPTASPMLHPGHPASGSSDIRRWRRSCGLNVGTPAAVHARVSAVRNLPALKPWNTRRVEAPILARQERYTASNSTGGTDTSARTAGLGDGR